jgi:glucose-1-phosphate thymidylyltransferase
MQAVILAAGRGKRLHPFTLVRSKAMLPVVGKPFIARILDRFIENSIFQCVIVHNPNDQHIQAFFSQNPQPGIELNFIEQDEPQGMAHALLQAETLIQGDFLLSACDSLLPSTDYAILLSAWNSTPKPNAVLSLLPVASQEAGSTALVRLQNGWISEIIEKPQTNHLISNISSLPIYIFNQQIFSFLKQIQPSIRGELELQDAIQRLINQQGYVLGTMVSGRLNLTSAEDLLDINLHFLREEQPQIILEPAQVSNKARLIPPFFIGPRTSIDEGCIIGPYVYLESACSIAMGCQISESVLLNNASVGKGTKIHHQIISATK